MLNAFLPEVLEDLRKISIDPVERELIERFLNSIDLPKKLAQAVPIGTLAIITSSLLPIYHSVYFSVLAGLAGNKIILKPAPEHYERVLAAFQSLRRTFLPLQDLRIIYGDQEEGRNLVCSQEVDGVIFQGTFENAIRVKQDLLPKIDKPLFLYSGVKNPYVFLERPSDRGISTLVQDVCAFGGQSCLSASLVFILEGDFDDTANRLIGAFTNQKSMVALDESKIDRFLKGMGTAEREGFKFFLRGTKTHSDHKVHIGPSLFGLKEITAKRIERSITCQAELLGPGLMMLGYKNEEDLIEKLKMLSYGNFISLWTDNQDNLKQVANRVQYGRVQLNKSFYDFDPWATHSSKGRSGNHALYGVGLVHQLQKIKIK